VVLERQKSLSKTSRKHCYSRVESHLHVSIRKDFFIQPSYDDTLFQQYIYTVNLKDHWFIFFFFIDFAHMSHFPYSLHYFKSRSSKFSLSAVNFKFSPFHIVKKLLLFLSGHLQVIPLYENKNLTLYLYNIAYASHFLMSSFWCCQVNQEENNGCFKSNIK